jgi:hypothetical protein
VRVERKAATRSAPPPKHASKHAGGSAPARYYLLYLLHW